MTGFILIFTFIIAIVIMIIAISKFKVHPFLAIMGVALILGIITNIPIKTLPSVIGSGFSGIFTSIGIVIILGALIGIILEKTGAAIKLADMVVKLVGKKHPELAIMIMGWIVSIPVFCDSGFVILDPIRKALKNRTQTSSVAMTVALSAGLYAAHVFIPPTPGPIAAAGMVGLGNNLLLIMGLGLIISIPTLFAAYCYALFIGKYVKSVEDLEDESDSVIISKTYEELIAEYGVLPNNFWALTPILMPILLMALGSLAAVFKWSGDIFPFLGSPIIALTVGLLFGVVLLIKMHKLADFNAMTNETLKIVGPILFVTAAGGVLGKIITEAGFVIFIKDNVEIFSSIGILFPFLIAAILKTAQGSSTVAITTTAAILGSFAAGDSMIVALGLTTPFAAALAVMAIGAGAMSVSHANDSYFWVVTNFGGMTPSAGYKTQTMVTLVMGITAMISIFILSLFI